MQFLVHHMKYVWWCRIWFTLRRGRYEIITFLYMCGFVFFFYILSRVILTTCYHIYDDNNINGTEDILYIAISKRKCNQSSTRLGGLYKTVWLFWVCNETRERVYCSFRPTIYEYICRETCLQRSVFVCFSFKNFFFLFNLIYHQFYL